jgi:hypothetical protein
MCLHADTVKQRFPNKEELFHFATGKREREEDEGKN